MDASCNERDGRFEKTRKGKEAVLVSVAKPGVCFCKREVSGPLLLAASQQSKSLHTHTHTHTTLQTALPHVDKREQDRGHLSPEES